MRALNTNTIIKRNGKTADIVSTVMYSYNKDWQQVSELAKTFLPSHTGEGQGVMSDIELTCRNIFNYVIQHVRYKEDPAGVQWVKTPARLISDGVGDCKSMAIFIASCLRCLGIEHKFRFVSFSEKKEATHVYAVAVETHGRVSDSKEIIIDPVVRIDGKPCFNTEEKYTYKSDMAGTDIYYMAGIKRRERALMEQHYTHSVGAAPDNSIWFGEFPDDYSKAKMSLLSFLELKLAEVSIVTSNNELAQLYNDLDKISLAIYAIEHTDNKEDFTRACLVIAEMEIHRTFNKTDTDINFRNENLIALKSTLQSRMTDYQADTIDTQLYGWLQTHAIDLYDDNKISGIGNVSKAQEAAQKIKDSGIYYIYTFITDDVLHKYPLAVLKKKNIQHNVYGYVDSTDAYHSTAIQANLVRTGIITSTGKTPEQLLSGQNLKEYKISGVGSVAAVIGAITALISLIKLIVGLFAPKRPAPSEDEINKGVADYEKDFPGFDPGATSGKKTNTGNNSNNTSAANVSIPLIIAGAAMLLMKTNKQ